jgi:putative transcriptional regulator
VNDSGPIAGKPIDTVLAAYAAGTLSAPLSVLVTSHLQMKAENRPYVAGLEGIGGAMLDTVDPVPVPDRDRRLAAIVSTAERGEWPEPLDQASDGMNALLPPALCAYLGRPFDTCRWRTRLPGLQQCVIAKDAAREVSFLRCRAGKSLPAHSHDGLEATLILAGGYSDVTGRYARGDIAIADETIKHRPIIDRDGECVVFLVLEGGVRLTSPWGRILQRLMG